MKSGPGRTWTSILRFRPVTWRAFRSAGASLAGALAVVGAAAGAGRAQQPPLTFREVTAAGFHTGYEATQRTTVINGRRQNWFESRILQNAGGPRLVRVTAPPRRAGELEVDDGSYRWRYQPRLGTVTLLPSPAARQKNVKAARPRIAQNVLTLVGPGSVAGRAATIYTVTPVRVGSPILRLWVDDATLVPLRTDWTARDGRQISQAFIQISMGSRPAPRFSWPSGALLNVRTWPGPAAGLGGPSGAQYTPLDMPLALPEHLPAGALFDGIWLRQLAGRQVLWLRFHQGGRGESLFETLQGPEHPVPPGEGVENWDLGPLNLTLVGSLPPAAQARLRGSIRLIRR